MRQLLWIFIVGILTGALTSCAASSGDDPSAQSPAASAPSEKESSQAPAESSSDDTDANIDADESECLHGLWLADNDFFLARIQELGDEVQSVTGRVTLQFDADGTLTTEYENWVITAVAEGIEVQLIRVGVDAGEFVISGHTIDLADTHVTSTLTMTHGATEMVVPSAPASYTGAPYSCSPTAATIESADGVLQLSRL